MAFFAVWVSIIIHQFTVKAILAFFCLSMLAQPQIRQTGAFAPLTYFVSNGSYFVTAFSRFYIIKLIFIFCLNFENDLQKSLKIRVWRSDDSCTYLSREQVHLWSLLSFFCQQGIFCSLIKIKEVSFCRCCDLPLVFFKGQVVFLCTPLKDLQISLSSELSRGPISTLKSAFRPHNLNLLILTF